MICNFLNLRGPRPVSFQGRINGAKGMWTISEPYGTNNTDVWIQITTSQLKVVPQAEDWNDECDRWVFELVKYNPEPRASNLHIDFVPILLDRGVRENDIRQLIRDQLTLDFETFFDTLDDPCALRRRVAEAFAAKETRNRDSGILWIAGMPVDDNEKVINLLDAGF